MAYLDTSLNWHIIPTPEEVQNMEESVKALELQLQKAISTPLPAQHIIACIERQIIEINAWIAPIRRIPHDILPIIFLEVCKMDWSAPLTLRQVCRSWRDATDTTPAAWSFIPFHECRSYQHGSAFFTRSAPCVLHNTIQRRADPHIFKILSDVAGRMQCLTINVDHLRDIKRYSFPILERLQVLLMTPSSDEDIAFILKSDHFPKLRSLNATMALELLEWTSIPVTNFVPLLELTITAMDPRIWVRVLEQCCSSLKYLSVSLLAPDGNFKLGERTTISFPHLESLSIEYWSNETPIPWVVDARTPVLHSYQEAGLNAEVSKPIHGDTESVEVLSSMAPIDLSMFPRLRQLQFWPQGLPFVLDMLSRPSICSNLETIIHTEIKDTNMAHIKEAIAVRNRLTGANIQFGPGRKRGLRALYAHHGMDFSCGPAMPCGGATLSFGL